MVDFFWEFSGNVLEIFWQFSFYFSGTMKIQDPAEKVVVFFLKMAKNGLLFSFYFSGTMKIPDPAEKMVVFSRKWPIFP